MDREIQLDKRIEKFSVVVAEVFSGTDFDIVEFEANIMIRNFLVITELLEKENTELFRNITVVNILEYLSSNDGCKTLQKVAEKRKLKSEEVVGLIGESYALSRLLNAKTV